MANAPDCGSGDRGFESHYPPFEVPGAAGHRKRRSFKGSLGHRQAVKAQDFDSCIRWFKSNWPSQGAFFKPEVLSKGHYGALAQAVEHLTFNQVVGGSNPPCLREKARNPEFVDISANSGFFICLKTMENNRLIKRLDENDEITYHLTEKGHSLNKVFYELLLFALNNDKNNEHYNDYEKEELKEMHLEILDLNQE